jgi:hypothetical protein
MQALWIILPILLAIPALYFLFTRRAVGGSGGDRADYTTDSPNDRPPHPRENTNRARNT